MTELSTTPCRQVYTDTAEPPDGPGGPSGAPLGAGAPVGIDLAQLDLDPHQQTVPLGMLDPVSFGFECLCQPSESQLTNSDVLMEIQSSLYQVLSSAVPPAPSDSCLPPAPWFLNQPFPSSLMVSLPVDMNHQQLQDRPPEVTLGSMQTVMYSVTEHGHVMNVVNPHDPRATGPTVETVQGQPNREMTPGRDLSVRETSSEYYQTACSLYPRGDQTAVVQPPAPQETSAGTLCDKRSRKPCHCTRTRCLKLYCDCFANGVMCSDCNCSNCHNNAEHGTMRLDAIKSCLGRNPNAFKPKIAGVKSGAARGCHCRRSGCLKNYCECYEASIMCTSSCKCVGCQNYDDSRLEAKERTGPVRDKCSGSVLTRAHLETVCGRLLAQAEEAEKFHTPVRAQRMILEEFGLCASEIVKAVVKNSPR